MISVTVRRCRNAISFMVACDLGHTTLSTLYTFSDSKVVLNCLENVSLTVANTKCLSVTANGDP
jgi:hypothetical protein